MSRVERMSDILQSVVDRANAMNPPEKGDYIDDEGFLVCGKCHTRRECMVEVPNFLVPGEMTQQKVRTQCRCREAAYAEEQERKRREEEMAAISALKKQSLMDERLADATFENFRQTEKNARNLKLCKSYAERFDEMLEKNQGLLFYGGVGTGKTFAAACIANYLLDRRRPVVMTSFVKLLESLKGFEREDSEVIARLNRAKLLIIDDLGAERDTGFAIEKVYDIIDSRYRAKLPVILTTNLSMDEMKAATDIRYARIYDRIFEMCYPMQFMGKSWRKVEASRRFNDMKKLLEGNDG